MKYYFKNGKWSSECKLSRYSSGDMSIYIRPYGHVIWQAEESYVNDNSLIERTHLCLFQGCDSAFDSSVNSTH